MKAVLLSHRLYEEYLISVVKDHLMIKLLDILSIPFIFIGLEGRVDFNNVDMLDMKSEY
jgi:hypothetical protein